MKRLLLPCLILLALAGATNAAASTFQVDLYNNLSNSIDGSESVYGMGPLAASFSTDANGYLLTTVGIYLGGDPTNFGAGTNVNLLSDAAGAPGSFLLYLTSISDPSYANCPPFPFCVVEAFVSYQLAPNTRYWIQVIDNSLPGTSTSAFMGYTNDTSGTGVLGEFHADQSGVSPNDFSFQMQVSAIPISPTPEPGSVPLLFGGLMSIAIASRRRLRS